MERKESESLGTHRSTAQPNDRPTATAAATGFRPDDGWLHCAASLGFMQVIVSAQANSFSREFSHLPSLVLPSSCLYPSPLMISMSVDEEAAQMMEGGKMQTVIDRGMAEAGQRKRKSGQRHASHRQRVINSPELTGHRNDLPSLLCSAQPHHLLNCSTIGRCGWLLVHLPPAAYPSSTLFLWCAVSRTTQCDSC